MLMKQQIRLFISMLLLAVISVPTVQAQKTMDVSKFSRLDNDLMARVTKPVRDKDEGKLCALIRVVTNITDLSVRADALGIVQQEQHDNGLWLYVPYGARSISFSRQGYFPLLYQYSLPIEEGTVYELRLTSLDSNTGAEAQKTNTQLFVLTHNPEKAQVYVDDMEVASENGVFAAMMSKGEHTYKVVADQYEDATGEFSLDDQPVRATATLAPLFATFQLFTLPENNFKVSVNGKQVGVSPYKSGRLEPGNYRIHIEKDKFYSVDTLIRLREGDNLNLTCKLTSFSDSLFYNRELGGKKISFGINVGYVMPMVSSSAGGGFTGSAINYSLGDSRENVSYTAQSGFTAGVMADVKLYKNFYLIAGVNYTMIQYTNKFNEPFSGRVARTVNDYAYVVDYANKYEEKYTHSLIEVPILASYRFVLTKTGSVHLNIGPYISYGLSAKLKLTGSSEYSGTAYLITPSGSIDYRVSGGQYDGSDHTSGNIDLLSKNFAYTRVIETSSGLSAEDNWKGSASESPFNKLNYGLKVGATYELRGFQVSLNYNYQLSNMAQSGFWEGTRIPLFNLTGENRMSGYKHRLHSLELKVGYMLRY